MQYYETKDLADFPNIGEWTSEEAQKFFDYYARATGDGKLSEREKTLIALAVAATQNCPYCIDAYTNKCLSLGVDILRMNICRKCNLFCKHCHVEAGPHRTEMMSKSIMEKMCIRDHYRCHCKTQRKRLRQRRFRPCAQPRS